MADLVESMKRAALEAVAAGKPVAVLFGQVLSAHPPRVRVEQKLTLGAEQLVLTRSAASAIEPGASVALLRVAGGQKFVVLDVIA